MLVENYFPGLPNFSAKDANFPENGGISRIFSKSCVKCTCRAIAKTYKLRQMNQSRGFLTLKVNILKKIISNFFPIKKIHVKKLGLKLFLEFDNENLKLPSGLKVQ